MSAEGQQRLADGLEKALDYYAREYDLTYAEILGVLRLIMFNLECDACCGEDSEEDQAEGEADGQS